MAARYRSAPRGSGVRIRQASRLLSPLSFHRAGSFVLQRLGRFRNGASKNDRWGPQRCQRRARTLRIWIHGHARAALPTSERSRRSQRDWEDVPLFVPVQWDYGSWSCRRPSSQTQYSCRAGQRSLLPSAANFESAARCEIPGSIVPTAGRATSEIETCSAHWTSLCWCRCPVRASAPPRR